MNLTPANWKKSELTNRSNELKVGTEIYYIDACNYLRFVITKVLSDVDFEIKNIETNEIGYLDISSCQLGWNFV